MRGVKRRKGRCVEGKKSGRCEGKGWDLWKEGGGVIGVK